MIESPNKPFLLYIVSNREISISDHTKYRDFEVSFEYAAPVEFSQVIKKHIESAIKYSKDFIVISNGNHEFTDSYNGPSFFSNIKTAKKYDCDILCGGVGRFGVAVPINNSPLWIDNYSSCNFVVIYRSIIPPEIGAVD